MGAPVVGDEDKSVLEDMVELGGCKFANEMDGRAGGSLNTIKAKRRSNWRRLSIAGGGEEGGLEPRGRKARWRGAGGERKWLLAFKVEIGSSPPSRRLSGLSPVLAARNQLFQKGRAMHHSIVTPTSQQL